jgi:hypothetical protein
MIAALAIAFFCILFLYDMSYFLFAFYKINSRRNQSDVSNSKANKLILKPDRILLRHTLTFWMQKLNYYVHSLFGLFYVLRCYLFPKAECFETNIKLIFDSPAMMAYLTDFSQSEDGECKFAWSYENFKMPLSKKDVSSVHIEARVRKDTNGRYSGRFESFVLDGDQHKDDVCSQMNILMSIIISVTHTSIHGHFNVLYKQFFDKMELASATEKVELLKYERLVYFGTFLNEVANWFPGVLYSLGADEYGKLVIENCANLNPPVKHATMLSNPALLDFVPVAKFVWKVRLITIKLMRKYNVPLDAELVFISAVLHALDHHTTVNAYGYNLGSYKGGKPQSSMMMNFLMWMFVMPLKSYLFSNELRDNYQETEFYHDWYSSMKKIDENLANKITLSISY